MTAQYAVVGDPVEHSLSPAIQQSAFDSLGIDARYSAIKADEADLDSIFDDLRRGRLAGFNVTMPHKTRAFELTDQVEGEAERSASINTVFMRGEVVFGASTDIGAIRDEWDRKQLPKGSVLVLGAGGAAAAALVALSDMNLYATARSTERLEVLLRRLDIHAQIIPWGEPVPGAVIVNATPIGMNNDSLPGGLIAESDGLFEMAYGALPTKAEIAARMLGNPVVTGVDMLVSQAAASFSVWTGEIAPLEVMRTAAQIAQGR